MFGDVEVETHQPCAVCEGLLVAGLQQLCQGPRQDMGHREGVGAKGRQGNIGTYYAHTVTSESFIPALDPYEVEVFFTLGQDGGDGGLNSQGLSPMLTYNLSSFYGEIPP